VFAVITVEPGLIAAWLIIGLLAGLITVRVMKGGMPALVGFSVLAAIGAVVGGMVFSNLATGNVGFWGSFAAAFLGAHLLIAVFRFAGFKQREQ
jgi:uncharacterized membrane protein YeaQ/YmgE (transglycosylase-associated protein family)